MLLDGEAERLTRAAIDRALERDTEAMRRHGRLGPRDQLMHVKWLGHEEEVARRARLRG